MASRYSIDTRINLGQQLGTNRSLRNIRASIKKGMIPVVNTMVTTGEDRLDTLSGVIYGDSRYWWILAAASGIGWGMQVPPGTVIKVLRLSDVMRLLA